MGLPGSYIVATDNSYVGSLVKLAGGTNVYGDGGGEEFLTANTEDMQTKDPDIILRAVLFADSILFCKFFRKVA